MQQITCNMKNISKNQPEPMVHVIMHNGGHVLPMFKQLCARGSWDADDREESSLEGRHYSPS